MISAQRIEIINLEQVRRSLKLYLFENRRPSQKGWYVDVCHT